MKNDLILNKDSEWWFVGDNTIKVNEFGFRDDLTGEDEYRGLQQDLTEQEVVDKLNELYEENQFLKEKEKDMLDYLKKEYDYVYNQKRKHLDDAILVSSYELIEYHIRSMMEHLEGL